MDVSHAYISWTFGSKTCLSVNMDQNPGKEKTRKVAGISKRSLSSSPSPSTGRTKTEVKKLSTDPQSVAARQRRHRISDRFKMLRSLVPGAHKMDTVSMLDGAIRYVKFLKAQILLHHQISIFFGGPHAVSGKDCDSEHDSLLYHYYYQSHYPGRTTEMSFSGSAELVDEQPTPNPQPPTGFPGKMAVEPGSLQLLDFPVPDSCIFDKETMLYYE